MQVDRILPWTKQRLLWYAFLDGANVAITDAGATDLGASTVSGTLGITSGGAVTIVEP